MWVSEHTIASDNGRVGQHHEAPVPDATHENTRENTATNNQHLPTQKQTSSDEDFPTQLKWNSSTSSWGHNLSILKCLTGCWRSDNNSSNLHLIEVLKSGLSLHQRLIRWEPDRVWRMCSGDVTTQGQGPGKMISTTIIPYHCPINRAAPHAHWSVSALSAWHKVTSTFPPDHNATWSQQSNSLLPTTDIHIPFLAFLDSSHMIPGPLRT